MEYAITADHEFLRVKASGRDSDQPPSEFCRLVFRESESSGRRRILIELDQKFPLSPTSQHQLVTRLPEIGFTREHRIALFHGSSEMRKANDFINLIASNRGLQVRNFSSLEDAQTWLRE